MANTITKQTIVNSDRNLVVKLDVLGDGSGEETATSLVDVSAFSCTGVSLASVKWSLTGFTIDVLWDATANTTAQHIFAGDSAVFDYRRHGGLPNPKNTGYTGDILFTTVGLGSGDAGTVVFEFTKHGVE